jgi:hypothetical protein
MLKQTLTGKTFLKLTSKKDIIKFKLGKNREDYLNKLNEIADKINKNGCDFSSISVYRTKKSTVYKTKDVSHIYSLRFLKNILTKIYKVKQADRDIITNQVSTLVSDNSPYKIIKGDIEKFYESIPNFSILSKVNSNRIVSFKNREILGSVFNSTHLATQKGLPRGISVSAPLSELYLRDFDRFVRSIEGVYYYARYVDDFIVFCHDDAKNILAEIEEKLKSLFLSLNKKKTRVIHSGSILKESDSLSFLGYEHKVHRISNKIIIRISKNRIRKIKTRIILAFLDYANTKDIRLLILRMKFITGNYLIKESFNKNTESKGLMAGFYYNNKNMNDFTQIRELDIFLMKILTSKKGSLFRSVGKPNLDIAKSSLSGINFEKGFRYRKLYKIEQSEFKLIKSCWINEEFYEK